MKGDGAAQLKPPFMVFWELNHISVVEGFVGNRVYLSDPATGRRSIDEQSFRQSYTGIVFSFEPGPGFHKGGEAEYRQGDLTAKCAGCEPRWRTSCWRWRSWPAS